MQLSGKGSLISKRNFVSKNGKEYFFIKVVDELGNELEMSTKGDMIDFKQFSKCEFTVDAIQGKYPRFDLININVLKA